ncbi:MAG: response regulator [Acidobacteriota bacterium]
MTLALDTARLIERDEKEGSELVEKTRKRILVVDDEAHVLFALSRLFNVLEVDVETCANPVDAVGRIDSSPYDLVISDQKMPQMNGLDVLRHVRASSPRTPTILMTAYGDSRTFNHAYESCGVFRYLTKPWDNTDLIITVKEALRAADALLR